MPNQPKTPNRTFRIDPEILRLADAKAKAHGTNLSEVVRLKLVEYIYEDEDD